MDSRKPAVSQAGRKSISTSPQRSQRAGSAPPSRKASPARSAIQQQTTVSPAPSLRGRSNASPARRSQRSQSATPSRPGSNRGFAGPGLATLEHNPADPFGLGRLGDGTRRRLAEGALYIGFSLPVVAAKTVKNGLKTVASQVKRST